MPKKRGQGPANLRSVSLRLRLSLSTPLCPRLDKYIYTYPYIAAERATERHRPIYADLHPYTHTYARTYIKKYLPGSIYTNQCRYMSI